MDIILGFIFVSLTFQLLESFRQMNEGRHRNLKTHDNAVYDITNCKHNSSLCNTALRLSAVHTFLHSVTRKYPKTTKLNVIGRTCSRQPIHLLEIFSGGDSVELISVIVEFGIHGREWASQASGMHVITRLLQEGNLTKTIRWFILPLLNPDGYHHSVTKNNMWKKNRGPLFGTKCIGVDLNRNFDVGWELGTGIEPCKEDYAGPRPFSEPETNALRRFIQSLGPYAVDVYVSVHSCGQAILYPYSHTTKELTEFKLEQLQEAGAVMAKAMKKLRNRNYEVDVSYKYGGLSVSSSDYMFTRFHIPFVYTLELGDRLFFDEYDLHHCYHPPSSMTMEYLNKECFAGLAALASHVLAKKQTRIDRYYQPRTFNSFPSISSPFVNLIASITLLILFLSCF